MKNQLNISPPKWADKLLAYFLPEDLAEELQGDMHEQFDVQVEEVGLTKARWLYVWEVLRFCRPYYLKRRLSAKADDLNTIYTLINPIMLSNYLKIAFRNLMRAKSYMFINISGLAVGIAACTLIILWIQDELQYDRFYSKTDRLYQVYNKDIFSGTPQVWEATPRPLGPTLKENYAEIEETSRFRSTGLTLSVGDTKMNANGAFVDPSFLSLFDFPLKSGHAQSVLAGNNGIVITEELAEKLFGTTMAIGKVVQVDNKESFSVTGVLEDLPDHSKFGNLSYLLPYNYFVNLGWGSDAWESNNDITYVLLKEHADEALVNQKIKSVTAEHLKGILDDVKNRQIFLHPASKWYLYSKQENGQLVEGRIVTVRLFGLIALFILLIAAVNFINLSTARSEKRAKEVGVRKVAGAQKLSLIIQFIGESLLLTFFAGFFALLIVVLSLPMFNQLTGKTLSLNVTSGYFWLSAIGVLVFTALLAGFYPAFFLANFQPSKVLKGMLRSQRAAFTPRKILVVVQFTFAIVLIVSTLIISRQIDYAQNRDKGFNQTNLIFTGLSGELASHYEALQKELIESGAVVSMGKSLGPITSVNLRQWGVMWPGSTQSDKDIEFDRFGTDANFVKTTGTSLVAGREIDVRQYPTDSTAVLLNETAVKTMQLKNPVGTNIKFGNTDWHVVGVVKDFVYASPFDPINPALIEGPGGPIGLGWLSIRLNPANPMADNVAKLEKIFTRYNPAYPFEYLFADESYKAKFADEQRTGTLTGLFTGLTIFIACLGLFGLAAYTAQQRTKEIGIRKALGAPVFSVVQLLTRDFIRLLLVAFAIGAPIGWYIMEQWLIDYKYRISIGVGVFLTTLISAIIIVLVSVSFQAIKAALVNPVKSLRSE
ncbi:ABC transporter permease [Emticicia agri]|uniref:FtsX-like permease family protein n=1 Tax=Emticicia agri TaxID=2492393 RepID=A0A4Q5LUB9_9BACT|nr:ABC transporter permease [Emticicia agri]RYU93194.1 FtsX-like permease family protein [Emticicia agri]